jgi:hypothetical protein
MPRLANHFPSTAHILATYIGKPKSKASRAAVPCVELLSKHLEEWRMESPYAGDDDWVFASFRNKGKTP